MPFLVFASTWFSVQCMDEFFLVHAFRAMPRNGRTDKVLKIKWNFLNHWEVPSFSNVALKNIARECLLSFGLVCDETDLSVLLVRYVVRI